MEQLTQIAQYSGALASVLFILATAFQALKSYKDGHSDGVSHGLIWSLGIGLISMILYVSVIIGMDLVLLSSYTVQLMLWGVVAKYKIKPERKGV